MSEIIVSPLRQSFRAECRWPQIIAVPPSVPPQPATPRSSSTHTSRVCVCGCVCVECMKQLLASSPATAKKQKKSSQSQHDGGNVFGFNEYESQIRPCWATSGGFDVGRRLTPASGMAGWRSRHENRQSLRQVDAGLRHAALC